MLPVTHTHMHTNIPECAARGKWHLFSLWWAPHVLDLIHSISQHLGGRGGCMTRGRSGGKGDERAVVYKCALVRARWVGSYQRTSQPKQHLKLPPHLLPPSLTFSCMTLTWVWCFMTTQDLVDSSCFCTMGQMHRVSFGKSKGAYAA